MTAILVFMTAVVAMSLELLFKLRPGREGFKNSSDEVAPPLAHPTCPSGE